MFHCLVLSHIRNHRVPGRFDNSADLLPPCRGPLSVRSLLPPRRLLTFWQYLRLAIYFFIETVVLIFHLYSFMYIHTFLFHFPWHKLLIDVILVNWIFPPMCFCNYSGYSFGALLLLYNMRMSIGFLLNFLSLERRRRQKPLRTNYVRQRDEGRGLPFSQDFRERCSSREIRTWSFVSILSEHHLPENDTKLQV